MKSDLLNQYINAYKTLGAEPDLLFLEQTFSLETSANINYKIHDA